MLSRGHEYAVLLNLRPYQPLRALRSCKERLLKRKGHNLVADLALPTPLQSRLGIIRRKALIGTLRKS